MKTIYLAGGCFWGVEEYFSRIKGVTDTTVGYANSDTENPTYEQICEHKVNAIETLKLAFDENVVSLETILDNFFEIIDPTSVDKQGEDKGHQYRTGIYYENEDYVSIINNKISTEQLKYEDKIVVEVCKLTNFFDAEEYHQDYLKKNPNGYCHIKF